MKMCEVCNGNKTVMVHVGGGITSFQPCLSCNKPKVNERYSETWADLERILNVSDPSNKIR